MNILSHKNDRRVLFLISLPGTDEFRSCSEDVARCVKSLRDMDVDVQEGITRGLLAESDRYDFVIVVAHYDDESDSLELAEGKMSINDFVDALPVTFSGILDFASCHSANAVKRIKGRCPECHVLAALEQTALALRMEAYPRIINLLNEDMSLEYQVAYRRVMNEIVNEKRSVPGGENQVGCSTTKLGRKCSSVYAPTRVKRKEPFMVNVVFHNDVGSNKIQLNARSAQKGAQQRRDWLSIELNKRDKIDVNISFSGDGAEHITADRATKSFFWVNSKYEMKFCVTVGEGFRGKTFMTKLMFEVNSEPAGECMFDMAVDELKTDEIPADVRFEPYDKESERERAKQELLEMLQSNINRLEGIISAIDNKEKAEPYLRDKEICHKCIGLLLSHRHLCADGKRVFVSSTSDLENYRQIAKRQILTVGMQPEMYEYWNQSPNMPGEEICRCVLDSDAMLCILGGKYGSVEETFNMSMTELEYRTALLAGKKILVFIIDPLNETEEPEELAQRQKALIKKIKASRILRQFENEFQFESLSRNDLKRL